MPLVRLMIYGSGINDLTPLQGMPLQEIRFTPQNITQGLQILREMQSLKIIGLGPADQEWPAAEFWERYGQGGVQVIVWRLCECLSGTYRRQPQ